ncbi:MAG: SDR family oxidoreductase [Novosphingobium sp.]|nr:SDR family oxidoreductase [Novosphingobium sp.]
MSRLSYRTCLITGASSGLGAHFARLAAREGARLVLGARRRERLEALVAELTQSGAQALAVDMDVTDEASVIAAYDAAEARFGLVDTIIANAGISAPGRSTELPVEAIRSVLDTNVLGVMLTAREGARRLIASGSRDKGQGRILLVGSMGGQIPIQGEAAYCASKAAVAHLGRSLAREWVRQGVNVNVIQPGFILTELAADWFASDGGKAQIEAFHRKRLQPIGSLDEPVIFFCSDAAAETTGAVLTIDDGQSL